MIYVVNNWNLKTRNMSLLYFATFISLRVFTCTNRHCHHIFLPHKNTLIKWHFVFAQYKLFVLQTALKLHLIWFLHRHASEMHICIMLPMRINRYYIYIYIYIYIKIWFWLKAISKHILYIYWNVKTKKESIIATIVPISLIAPWDKGE